MTTLKACALVAALLVLAPCRASAATSAAEFVYPLNGATNVSVSQPLQWTAVIGAQAYVLWIGTTPGADDLVNSGEIHDTSFLASALPGGRTVHVRLYTKVDGAWSHTSSTFATSPHASFINPTDGATNVDVTQGVTWNSVPAAQAHILWVGSTPGADNLINSGEIHTTSWSAIALPPGQTVHARIYTKVDGLWNYASASFTTAPVARLTYPADGQNAVDVSNWLTWTPVAGAQGYTLWIGTTPGASDLLNTGETALNSWFAPGLPLGQTMHARLYTKVGGVWRYTTATFSTAARAHFLYPVRDAVGVDVGLPLSWPEVPNKQAYILWVGTTPGGSDLVNTGEIQVTSWLANTLPAGQTVYARIYTKVGGVWNYSATSFSTAAVARLTRPLHGATNVDATLPLTWTSVPNKQAYVLWVGTTPGSSDVVNTGEIQLTSWLAPALPAGQTLYARIYTKVAGAWNHTNATFTTPPVAWFSYPLQGATGVDPLQPLAWTNVPNKQAYVLWVGTTPGGSDLVNTGEIQTTSWLAPTLPAGQTLYARIYTKVAGLWNFSSSTFSTAPLARFTYPLNSATNVDATRPLTWTDVPNRQAYVLWIGTTPGASDVVNTGEIQTNLWLAPTLPAGQTLYGRIYTKVSGTWNHTNVTFTTPAVAWFTTPLHGAVNVDTSQPLKWTSVPNRQAYVLWIGTAPGLSDLVNTGEVQATSWTAPTLPPGQTLHARIYTKVGGSWNNSTTTFTTAPVARFTHPANGETDVDLSLPLRWLAAPNVEAYFLQVGTQRGAADLVSTGEILSTSYTASHLPPGTTLFARIYTKSGGTWKFDEVSFIARPLLGALFTYPAQGAVGVESTRSFQWLPVHGAQAYYLRVGTSRGASDVVSTGALSATSYPIGSLPSNRTLYAHLLTSLGANTWRVSDVTFTLQSTVAPASIVQPVDGAADFDAARLFEWSDLDLAQGYRLQIGTAPGSANVHDSELIHVPRRYVPNLPLGQPLYGRVMTLFDGQWHTSDFAFSAAPPTTTPVVAAAHWAVDFVRRMATVPNDAITMTQLGQLLNGLHRTIASCSDYATVLLTVLAEMNLPAESRILDIFFNSIVDGHTLVEMQDPDTGSWILLDPTMNMTATRASDGGWATAEDLSNAALMEDWSAIQYAAGGSNGTVYAQGYYLDYPLLFLKINQHGTTWTPGQGPSLLPYLEEVAMPVSASFTYYLARCDPGDAQANLLIDGQAAVVQCNGVEATTQIFGASAVAAPGGGATLYKLKRFVF